MQDLNNAVRQGELRLQVGEIFKKNTHKKLMQALNNAVRQGELRLQVKKKIEKSTHKKLKSLH